MNARKLNKRRYSFLFKRAKTINSGLDAYQQMSFLACRGCDISHIAALSGNTVITMDGNTTTLLDILGILHIIPVSMSHMFSNADKLIFFVAKEDVEEFRLISSFA